MGWNAFCIIRPSWGESTDRRLIPFTAWWPVIWSFNFSVVTRSSCWTTWFILQRPICARWRVRPDIEQPTSGWSVCETSPYHIGHWFGGFSAQRIILEECLTQYSTVFPPITAVKIFMERDSDTMCDQSPSNFMFRLPNGLCSLAAHCKHGWDALTIRLFGH